MDDARHALKTLATTSNAVSRLHKHWQEYCRSVIDDDAMACLKNYQIPYDVSMRNDVRLEFNIIGIPLYVRFFHNLPLGSLEYGVVCSWNRTNPLYTPLKTYYFDDLGNLEKRVAMHNKAENFAFHVRAINEILPVAVTSHFGTITTDK